MSIGYSYLVCLLVFYFKTSNTQFMPVSKKPNKSNACEGTSSKTALTEHFFNVIFNEFHNNPPVCVCVQMCLDQPTYCYPNGCLKKADNKKKSTDDRPAPVTNIQNSESSNTLFLIDDKNDFINVLNENVDVGKYVPAERTQAKNMRPDPFKDRYKMLFKYKKMPIVELRYNLREQVKNMKSDILKLVTKDVSKTRWPNGIHIYNEQQTYKANEKKNDRKQSNTGTENTMYKSPVVDGNAYTSKYFKRDLRRNLKDDSSDEADGLTEKPDPLDNKNFSIETLIENLIGNNFGGKRDIVTELNIEVKNLTDDVNNIITTQVEETPTLNTNKSKDEVTCVVSMNNTNQNLDENKYTEDNPLVKERINKWKNYTFNEMIAILAKRIEKQNNTSMEMMRQASKHHTVATLNTTVPIQIRDNLKTAENTTLHKSLLNEIQTVVITRNKPQTVTGDSYRKKKTN